jgi:hypothetical protein
MLLGSYFEKEDIEVGIVISVLLMTMLVNIMLGTCTPPHHAILTLWEAVCVR